MLPARRTTLRASRAIHRGPRRRYSGHSDHHHTVDTAHHVEEANTTERLGPRFFLTLTALPLAWVAYDYSVSDDKRPPFLTRHLLTYGSWYKEWEKRNDLHTRAVALAADDKLLFRSADPAQMVDLKTPELFNAGSPFNNVAGHRADLSELVQHYHKKNKEMEDKVASKTQEQRDKYL